MINVITKEQIAVKVAEEESISQAQAKRIVAQVFEEISTALGNGEKVQIYGFGSFDRKTRAARQGRNPQTGQVMTIPARQTVGFKLAEALKKRVN